MAEKYTSPGRKSLIAGAIIAVIEAQKDLKIQECRRFNVDWLDNEEYLHLKEVQSFVRRGIQTSSHNRELRARLAHLQQCMYVSHEEWDESCLIDFFCGV